MLVPSGAMRFGNNKATVTIAANERAPLATHRDCQEWPSFSIAPTSAAETATPIPTPEKCSAEKPLRPTSASRSNSSADAIIRTNALAAPPRKRSTRKDSMSSASPMAAVVTALTVRAPSSHRRCEPGNLGKAASKAPMR